MTRTADARFADAAQRELLRRLHPTSHEGGLAGVMARGSVADLVLRTPVGGRGRVDPGPRAAYGDLPVTERDVLRVAVSVIAAWAGSAPAAPAPEREVRPAPWRRGVVVAGASPQAQRVRAAVRATGRGSDGWKPTVLVVGGPLDAMVAQHWRHRVERGAGLRWRRVWATMAARDALPAVLDPAGLAEGWVARIGAARVHVVLASDPGAAVATAGRVLGLPLRDARAGVTADPVGTDLLRRLNQVLATSSPAVRARLRGTDLAPVLDETSPPAIGVPRGHLDWAVARADRLAGRLTDPPAGAAYTVHGDPRVVVPSTGPGTVRSIDPARTLERALAVLRRIDGGDPWRGR